MRNSFVPILFALFLLTACAPQMPTAQAEVASSATPTAVPTATALPSPLPTSTPTATLPPTATATPTPTPITLPVTNGTPVPDLPYEVITAENVHRLRQIARYGYPRLLENNPYRLTADGKMIVVGTTLGLEFYDAQTQAKTGGFEVEFLRSFDLTPDGRYLLTLGGETLTVWTKDGQKVREFALEAGDAWTLNAVALSPDGSLLAVQRPRGQTVEQDKVDVYRVSDGTLLDTVRGMGALFSPDGRYLATVFDGSVRLYPAAELGEGWEKRLPKETLPWCGAMEGRCGLVFSADGTLAAVVRAGRVDVYEVESRKLVRQVSGWEVKDTYYLPQVQFAPNGEQALITTLPVYDSQGKVQTPAQAILVDIASGEWVSKSEVEDGFAYPEGGRLRVLALKQPIMARFLGIRDNGELVLESEKCQIVDSNFTCYWLSRDGADWRLISEHNTTVLQFKSLGEDSVKVWVFPKYIVINQVWNGWTPKGKLCVYNSDGDMIVETSGLAYFANTTKSGTVAVLVFGETRSEIIIVRPGEKPHFLYRPFLEALMMGISDDVLVTFGHREIVFWSPDGFLQRNRISKYLFTDSKAWVKLSPDEKMFLFSTGSLQNGINVVDLNSSEPNVTHLLQNIGVVYNLSFSVDGRFLLTSGNDGFIRVWAVVPDEANVR